MPLVLSHDKSRAGHKDPEAIRPTKSKMFHRPLMKTIDRGHPQSLCKGFRIVSGCVNHRRSTNSSCAAVVSTSLTAQTSQLVTSLVRLILLKKQKKLKPVMREVKVCTFFQLIFPWKSTAKQYLQERQVDVNFKKAHVGRCCLRKSDSVLSQLSVCLFVFCDRALIAGRAVSNQQAKCDLRCRTQRAVASLLPVCHSLSVSLSSLSVSKAAAEHRKGGASLLNPARAPADC